VLNLSLEATGQLVKRSVARRKIAERSQSEIRQERKRGDEETRPATATKARVFRNKPAGAKHFDRLRAGLATAAAMADVSERSIMAQIGHKSLPAVRRYIRDGSLFRRNAAAAVGL